MDRVIRLKNYKILLNSFFQYLPSRFLVVINSLIIIPFLGFILTQKEMGIYQLSVGALNLLCTCSTDWITKSSLRFYEKYKLENKLEEFYSNIIFISLIAYIAICIAYFISKDNICTKFYIPHDILLTTIILIIPCGIRQFLYQMLRILNRPFLYTFSIIIYQFTHLIFFLALFKISHNISAILNAMIIAMVIIDIYIIKEIKLKEKIKLKIEQNLIQETLKYSLPTIITNTSIWTLLHINKFVFQRMGLFNLTATAGIAWVYTSYLLTPLFSTFLFAVFPIIIKKYENKQAIKSIVTSTIQLYSTLFIPIISLFLFYSKEITSTMFSTEYSLASTIFPFFATTIFLHELMKIINVKYHLKNKTYIEMLVTIFIGIICILLNIILIPEYKLLGAGIAMLISMILLIIFNSLINFQNIDYLYPKKIFKSAVKTLLISILIFILLNISITRIIPQNYQIITPILFIVINYITLWNCKNKILV